MAEAVTWVPSMDVYEIDNDYIVDAELPGVERGDIKIEFSGLDVTIRGERRFPADCDNESYRQLEGHRGRFRRRFSLPEPVDRSRVRVELKNGVLHLVLPKSGRQTSRISR